MARTSLSEVDERLSAVEASVGELCELIRHLTEAVDFLTDEFERVSRRIGQALFFPTSHRLTSMPLDPVTDDWHINQVKPEHLPADSAVSLPDGDIECHVYCRDCDFGPVSLEDAQQSGWTDTSLDNAVYFGVCPACAKIVQGPVDVQKELFE